MLTFEVLYVISTLLTGTLSLLLAAYILRIEEPMLEVRGLALYLGATGIGAFFFALMIVADAVETMLILLNVNWTFVIAGVLGYVHFGLALTGNLSNVRNWHRALGFGASSALIGALWIDTFRSPLDGVFRAEVDVFTAPFQTVDVTYGVLGLLFVGYLALLTAIGTYLVFQHLSHSQSRYRMQGVLVLVAITLPWVGSALTFLNVPDPAVNLTPQSAAVSAVLLAVAISRYGLLNIVPLAHAEIIENIDDYVLIAGAGDRVVDTNGRAMELVTDPDPLGKPLTEILPFEISGTTDIQTVFEREVTLERNGRRRVLTLRSRPLQASDSQFVGRAVTLREVTDLKAREQELELLKQVLSRVLRHNIRNSLIVIQSRAEFITQSHDRAASDHARSILESADELASTSEKARKIEQVLDYGSSFLRFDLSVLVRRTIATYRERYPAVSWSVDVPERCGVQAHPMLELAVENVLENAIEHNDDPNPEVAIEIVEGSPVELWITDNGPGIPEHEMAIIDQREETPLTHGTGVGLWLINWIVEKSAGSISVRGDESGTTVVFELTALDDPAGPLDGAEPLDNDGSA